MSLTHDSQVIGTAKMVSNSGTVIVKVVCTRTEDRDLVGKYFVEFEVSHLLLALKSIGSGSRQIATRSPQHVITTLWKLFDSLASRTSTSRHAVAHDSDHVHSFRSRLHIPWWFQAIRRIIGLRSGQLP